MNKPKLYKRGASWHCEGNGIHYWAKTWVVAYTSWKIKMLNSGLFKP